jgi:hypothetical protein
VDSLGRVEIEMDLAEAHGKRTLFASLTMGDRRTNQTEGSNHRECRTARRGVRSG